MFPFFLKNITNSSSSIYNFNLLVHALVLCVLYWRHLECAVCLSYYFFLVFLVHFIVSFEYFFALGVGGPTCGAPYFLSALLQILSPVWGSSSISLTSHPSSISLTSHRLYVFTGDHIMITKEGGRGRSMIRKTNEGRWNSPEQTLHQNITINYQIMNMRTTCRQPTRQSGTMTWTTVERNMNTIDQSPAGPATAHCWPPVTPTTSPTIF